MGARREAHRLGPISRLRFLRPVLDRRQLLILCLVVGAHAGALAITYRSVVFHHRTLLTGAVSAGTEGDSGPYGYPGHVPVGWNETDPGASAWQFVPQVRKAHAEMAQGHLPLWAPNVMLGAPLAADPIHGLHNPLTWPLLARPTTGVWDLWLLSRLLMAGVLCSYLALDLGLRLTSATLAGLIYMMSGTFQLRTTTVQTGVMAMLPLLILSLERCLRRPSRGSAALVAVAVASTLLFGMPEQSVLCLLMGLIYVITRLTARWYLDRQLPDLRAVYAGLGGSMVGVLLSLPLLIPALEYLGLGSTTHGVGAQPARYVEDPHLLLRLVGPRWNSAQRAPFGAATVPFDNWLGAGALYLGALGAWSRALPRGVRTLLVVTALAVEAKTVGLPAWYSDLVSGIPVLSRISLWAYTGVFVSLAVALLGGAGLQRLGTGQVTLRGALAVGLGLLIVMALLAPSFFKGSPVRWPQLLLTAGVLSVIALAASLIMTGRERLRVAGVGLLVGSVVTELIALATPEVPLALRYDPLTLTPTAAYLQRVMPSGTGRTFSPSHILYPTTNQAFNLDDIRNLDAVYVERTYRYLKLFVVPGLNDRFDGDSPASADYLGNPFLDALNVQRILLPPGVSAHSAGLDTDQFKQELRISDGVTVYKNLHAAPRAQVVFDVKAARTESEAAAAMARPGFNPSRTAIAEASLPVEASGRAPVAAVMQAYGADHMAIRTATAEQGVLVIADAFYPGWRAEVDGRPSPVFPVNLALRGVRMPAGKHLVTMRYEPASFTMGMLGIPAALMLFATGGWLLPAAIRVPSRRSRQPPGGEIPGRAQGPEAAAVGSSADDSIGA